MLTVPLDGVLSHFQKGEFILAFYRDNRMFEAEQPKHVEQPRGLREHMFARG